ncbi:MAG: hypothetical protein OXK78_08500 [Caldilineaceae bacterium]|nr:hypothetical protein [Caldilineaceae bacterium]
MDTLAAKLLLTLAFPVVVTIVWQSLTRSSWKVLPFALGAYILVHIVIIPVGQLLPYLLRFSYSSPDWGNFPYWIASLAIKGLFTEGIQWLILLFVATEVKLFKQGEELSWQEGVLFGLGYGSVGMLTSAGNHFFFLAWDAGVLSSTGPNMPAVFSLFQPSLGEAAVRPMNELLPWWAILNVTLGFGVTSLIFNTGSSLALFFSIQRKSVTFFLVAVAYYTLYSLTPELLEHSPFSGPIQVVGSFLIVSLPFLLIFRLRKTLPKARA